MPTTPKMTMDVFRVSIEIKSAYDSRLMCVRVCVCEEMRGIRKSGIKKCVALNQSSIDRYEITFAKFNISMAPWETYTVAKNFYLIANNFRQKDATFLAT